MKLVGKLLAYPIWAVNWAISLLMVFSCYASLAAPVGKWPFASLSGLAFPYLFAANFLFLIFWTIFWRKGALLPLITILVCLGPTLKYWPVHPFAGRNASDDDLTVVTYNTEGFGTDDNKDWSLDNPVLQHAISLGADILLMQETSASMLNSAKKDKRFTDIYPYIVSSGSPTGESCLSRYPIISHERISFEDSGNSSLYLRILMPGGDTLAVFNCHLQSNQLNVTDLEEYQKFIENPRDSSHYKASKQVLKKLLASTSQRSGQARLISERARSETARYLIVCGDFNDTQLSHSHRLFSRFMTDTYSKSGNGPGLTYHEHGLNYRIDHILCSRNMTPVHSRVDRTQKDSDHYPVISRLRYK